MNHHGVDSHHPYGKLHLNLLLCALTTVALLLGVEVSLRLLVPHWAPTWDEQGLWRYDELLGWAHVPEGRGTLTRKDFSTPVSINSHGLRDKEYRIERTAGKKRMLVLGDSFAWGWGVEDRQRFTELLEERYPQWEIINAAVSGYGTDQELLYYQHRGVQFHPDVVLLLVYSNDIDDNNSPAMNGYNKPRFQLSNGNLVLLNNPVPGAQATQIIKRTLLSHTIFLAQVYLAAVAVKEKLFERPVASGSPGSQLEYDLTETLLFKLDELVRANGSRLVVVSVPTRHEKVRRFLASALASKEIPYLPLDEALSDANEPVTFDHDHHWNATAHKVAAAAIEKFLRERAIFP